jgi:hypothetical protein
MLTSLRLYLAKLPSVFDNPSCTKHIIECIFKHAGLFFVAGQCDSDVRPLLLLLNNWGLLAGCRPTFLKRSHKNVITQLPGPAAGPARRGDIAAKGEMSMTDSFFYISMLSQKSVGAEFILP